MELLGNHAPLEIYCLDTWEGGQEHAGYDMSAVEQRFDQNTGEAIHLTGQQHQVFKIKGGSALGLSSFISQGKVIISI